LESSVLVLTFSQAQILVFSQVFSLIFRELCTSLVYLTLIKDLSIDPKTEGEMPLSKGEYVSDIWKDGIFGRYLLVSQSLFFPVFSSTFVVPPLIPQSSQSHSLLYRWRRHNLQRSSPRSRPSRCQCLHHRPKRRENRVHGERHRYGSGRCESARHW